MLPDFLLFLCEWWRCSVARCRYWLSYLLVFLLFQALIWARGPEGWASVIVAILFIGGVQLIGIGAVGEYVGRIFVTQNARPQFTVKEICRSGSAEDHDVARGNRANSVVHLASFGIIRSEGYGFNSGKRSCAARSRPSRAGTFFRGIFDFRGASDLRRGGARDTEFSQDAAGSELARRSLNWSASFATTRKPLMRWR